MKSMTGFGRAAADHAGWRIEIEVQSVNQKRGFDLLISLPREFSSLEPVLRQTVAGAAARGRLTLTATIKPPPTPDGLNVNRPKLIAAHRDALQLARQLRLPDTFSLEFLLRLPGVLETNSPPPDLQALTRAAARATRSALAQWQTFRQREGAHLALELARLLALIRKQLKRITTAAGQAKKHLAASLQKRLHDTGLDLGREDERVAKEIALLVERSDITEELARLSAHLDQAAHLIASGGDGRTLEFLLQEIGREVNTIGSKSQTLAISRSVVAIKADLEKMREQLQNLE